MCVYIDNILCVCLSSGTHPARLLAVCCIQYNVWVDGIHTWTSAAQLQGMLVGSCEYHIDTTMYNCCTKISFNCTLNRSKRAIIPCWCFKWHRKITSSIYNLVMYIQPRSRWAAQHVCRFTTTIHHERVWRCESSEMMVMRKFMVEWLYRQFSLKWNCPLQIV